MKRITLLFTLIFCAFTGIAQVDFNNYEPLKSQGEIPKDFYQLSSEKVAEETSDSKDKLNNEFILLSRYGIDEILHGGRVCFGDALSKYVSEVAKNVLKDDMETYNRLRFYILKSRITNAFSTDQGIICVTTGLLSQLETEAQLAVVLAHEISHFKEKHVHDKFIEEKSMDRSIDEDEEVVKLSQYSKEKEFEADIKGAEIFATSGYSQKALLSSFDILTYSYLPFDEIPFDKTFFNSELMTIPDLYFSDTISAIRASENEDDSKSTHPNVESRRLKVENWLEDNSFTGTDFQLSKEKFIEIRNIARFETVRMNLISRDFARCIYEIFILKKDFPNSQYLDLCLVKAIYGLTSYKFKNRLSKVSEKLKEVEGEQFQLNHLFEKLSKVQMATVALRVGQDLYLKHYPNTEFRSYRDLILKEILKRNYFKFDNFSNITFEEALKNSLSSDTLTEVKDSANTETVVEEVSKYDRIKKKDQNIGKKEVNKEEIDEEDFHFYALSDLMNDKKFKTLRLKIRNEIDAEKDLKQEEANNRRKSYRKYKKGAFLGQTNVLIFEPYVRFDHYKNDVQKSLKKSEEQKLKYINDLKDFSDQLEMKATVLGSKNLSRLDVDKFNALMLLKEYMLEVALNENHRIQPNLNSEILTLQKKFDFNYLFFPYVESSELTPKYTYYSYSRRRRKRKVNTYVGGLVINLTSGKIEHTFGWSFQGKPSFVSISAHLYDMLNQIKTTKK